MKQAPLQIMKTEPTPGLYLQSLRKHSLAVWLESEKKWRPIPAAVSPVTISRQDWRELTDDARLILSSFPILHGWLQHPQQKPLFDLLYGKLAPLDLQGALIDANRSWGHGTMRFDLFWHHDTLKVIETNCTIPAMQAYSDLILDAWFEAGGKSGQRPPQNSSELLNSLLALYKRDHGVSKTPTIGILHRPGDSQMAELQHYERTWPSHLPAGSQVLRVHPNDLITHNNQIVIKSTGQPLDLIYRHCFGWRLSDHDSLQNALLDYRNAHIYNPLSAHYEVKGFLALLSYVAQEPRLAISVGLSKLQIDSINSRVPTTRLVGKDLPADLTNILIFDPQEFANSIERYVIKNSIGYGGHQVLMGSEWFEPSVQHRLKSLWNRSSQSDPISPADFFSWIQNESTDLWIIQDRMTGRRHKTKIIHSDDSISEINGFVDASIFLNTGTQEICSGGVSRIAAGPVVNIGTGGGLAPLLLVD